mgnify:CR=1 FL=1
MFGLIIHVGFIGLATPSFLLALVIMWIAFDKFSFSASGLFSSDYIDAPWSWARVLDLMKHLPIPALIIGIGGTSWLRSGIRTLSIALLTAALIFIFAGA